MKHLILMLTLLSMIDVPVLAAPKATKVASAAPSVAAKAPIANPVLAPGDPGIGRWKSEDERCQECHGHDGNANDIEDGIGNIGKFPRLAGQSFDYIIKQIRNFRSGERNHETMAIMAKGIADVDLKDVAAYFSSQKVMQGDGSGDNKLARELFAQGDAARNIPACVSCHGERGKGAATINPQYPVIGGQHRRYLQKQLLEWRANERVNDPSQLMNSITKQLSDQEIDALADYLAGQ